MEWFVFWTIYLGLGAACTLAELIRPAHKVRYRKALVMDVIACLVAQFAVFEVAEWVTGPVGDAARQSPIVLATWLPFRIAAYYLAADFGSYWMHRLMHTRYAWRIHRWHHSPEQLYWLAGVRTTVPQQILFNLPYVLALPLLADTPQWFAMAALVENVARNHWMHMNVAWRSNWLERVFVTPRYHHIHHSADAALHDGNYGSLFSIWDRLFGTYIDPDTTTPKKFGTGERKRDPVLLMLGV